MRTRRLQMRWTINEGSVEARHVRNLGETPKTHVHGCRKYDNRHGVGIVLNKKWRQQIIDTEYINERVIIATIVVNHQRIELMSVYFLHSGDADHHVEKCTEQSRSTQRTTKIAYRLLEETSMLSWDQDAELNVQVLANTHSLNQSNTRGDWMKHWLMLQNFTALNTMYRKNLGKPTTYRSPKRNEKQIDYIILKRRHLKYNKDAEANDMIHMGSDHRCVMATFMITTPKKDGHRKKKAKLETTKHDRRDQTEKNTGDEKPELEKNTKRSLKQFKKKLKPQTKKWINARKNAETKKKAAAQAKSEKTEPEGKEADEEFSEIEVMNDVETVRETDEEQSWTSHTSERRGWFHRAPCRTRHGRENEDRHFEWRGLPWRRGHDGAQARRNDRKANWKRDRNRLSWWRTSWALHANGRKGRFHRATCRPRHEWERKERQIEWSRLLREWDHDGIQARRNKWSSSSKKDTWTQWGDLRGRRGNQKTIEERRTTPKEEKQRLKKKLANKKCIRDKKKTKRLEEIQRVLEDFKGIKNIPGIKSVTKKSAHNQDKEGERRSHCVTEGNCQCFWWPLQKFYDNQEHEDTEQEKRREWTWKQHRCAEQRHEWDDENSRDHDWRVTNCNQQTQRQIGRQQRNQSRRHQSMRRWDDRCGETDLQRNRKAKWIYSRGLAKTDNKSDKKREVEDVGNHRPICSLPALYKLFTTILYSRLYPWLDQIQAEEQAGFRGSYQTTDHLATHRMTDRKYLKCEPRQSTSWRRSTPSPTNQFGTPSNLAVSNMITSISWRNCIETRKPQYWQKVTCLRWRKEPNWVNHCQACSSTRICRKHWKKTFHVGRRKEEWEYAWATTIMTASQTWDLLPTCSNLHPQKNSSKKWHANSREVQEKWDSESIQERRKFSATKALNIRKEIEIDDIKVEVLTREESTKHLDQMITFQQQETTEIINRIRAAWATFHKNIKGLTSRTYMLGHRLRLFDAVVSPTMNYASGIWTLTKEHERMIQSTQRKTFD